MSIIAYNFNDSSCRQTLLHILVQLPSANTLLLVLSAITAVNQTCRKIVQPGVCSLLQLNSHSWMPTVAKTVI